MDMSRACGALGGLVMALSACSTAPPPPPQPPAECMEAWEDPASAEFLDLLLRATGTDHPVWGSYSLGDGVYVIHPGPAADGGACLGVFQAGETLAYHTAPEEPALLTPLYGYYFASDWHGGSDAGIVERSTQPPSIKSWLEGLGIESAVVMPVSVPDFPMQIPAIVKTQLAIHEAFHVVVQGPTWWAGEGEWPEWDVQPDRAGTQACFTSTPEVAEALGEERAGLVDFVSALIGNDTTLACQAGTDFLALRDARYALLDGVEVAQADGTPGTCEDAEILLELEEGTADYASWTALHDLGLVTDEQLIRRYQAIQNDVFYLTGAMQLHAVAAMSGDSMIQVTRGINTSAGPETGSMTSVLRRALDAFCR